MLRFPRFFPIFAVCAALLSAGALGCRAQTPPPTGSALDRRIELLIRNQMSLSEKYSITLGARTKSEFSGYDQIPVTFSLGEASRTIPFLISSDNKTLIRLDKYDLSEDPASKVSVAGRPYRGGKDAKVEVVVFDDLECPFCARMHRELFPQTLARYGDKIKIVYKDFPMSSIHPWALRASVDANCLAAENGDAYWSYVDFVHDHHDEVTGDTKNTSPSDMLSHADATLDRLAEDEGRKRKVDEKKLASCISAQNSKAALASMHEAESIGVDSTPQVMINGEKIVGWVDTGELWPVIDRALKDAGEVPPPPVTPVAPPPAATPGN